MAICESFLRKFWEHGTFSGTDEQSAKVFSTKMIFSTNSRSFLPQNFSAIWYLMEQYSKFIVYVPLRVDYSYIPRLHRSTSACGNILSATFKLVDHNLSLPLFSLHSPFPFLVMLKLPRSPFTLRASMSWHCPKTEKCTPGALGRTDNLDLATSSEWASFPGLTLFSPDFQTGLARSLSGILPLNIAD